MKKMHILFALLTILFAASSANAQMIITESFKVNADCNTPACKKHLEKSLSDKGMKTAEWDADTRTLTVTYDPKKIDMAEIRKKVDAVVSETATADNRGNKAAPVTGDGNKK